ncbi:MAG: restriction endonuclease subunit S [Clostridia bacterium]|nr:restriction endonuclease subunit S [Clostridia bacterium]
MDTKALRQKILDLAIRGKLVPQDPSDEPASVLLDRIRAEKQQMVKEGKLKAKDIKNDSVIFKGEDNLHYEKFADGTVECIEDEIPFDVPENWAWCRMETICPYGSCEKVDAKTIKNNEWILELEDIEKDTGVILYFVSKSQRNSISVKHRFDKGQLLYSKLRPYLNKVVIAPKPGYCTSEILPLTFYGNIVPKYMQIFLMSETFLAYVNMISYGVKMPRLGTDDGKRVLISIPPITEQRRIFEKVDELLDKISIVNEEIIALNESVEIIKSKILDLAVCGKLVPQDPTDEPASVLLERIRAEKEELIKQGKIKRDKVESVIFKGEDNSYYEKMTDGTIKNIDSEIPFAIPDHWIWTRLTTITNGIFAGGDRPNTFSATKTNECPFPIFSNGVTDEGLYGFCDKARVDKPSITISARGTIGYTCIRREPFTPIVRLITITPSSSILIDYLYYVFLALLETGTGSSTPQLTVPNITGKLIPLPPKNEQGRITDYIKNVFEFSDNVKASLE